MKLSVVSPVYKAEASIAELVSRIMEAVLPVTQDYEILLVEDGSPDDSWSAIVSQCEKYPSVKGIKLSRNFGQHYAISAGLFYATGDKVIVMDCDLQDDPKYIPQLLAKSEEGYDIVYTIKDVRKHSVWKNLTAGFFNSIFNWLVDNKEWKSSSQIGSYSLITRKVVDAFKSYKDYRRHYLMVLRWLGFNSSFVLVTHKKRFEGRSSYNLSKLINHAIDGITSQSDKLLRMTIILGFFLSSLSFIGGLYIIVRSLISPLQSGWASLSILILFVGGLIITSLGISAIYIGKIFEQTKGRPLYIIDKIVNE